MSNKETIGSKTTVEPGNSHYDKGGCMPSTTGNPSGGDRGNNPPHSQPSNRGSK